MNVFAMRPDTRVIGKMGVTVFNLSPYTPQQLGLFDSQHGDMDELSRSLDSVNDRYGDMVIGSALLANMKDFILDRVPFGSTKDIQDLYNE